MIHKYEFNILNEQWGIKSCKSNLPWSGALLHMLSYFNGGVTSPPQTVHFRYIMGYTNCGSLSFFKKFG